MTGQALPVLYTTGRSVRVGVVPETVAGHGRGPPPSRVAGLRASGPRPGHRMSYGVGEATETGRNLKFPDKKLLDSALFGYPQPGSFSRYPR
jgi:hypothetical protein